MFNKPFYAFIFLNSHPPPLPCPNPVFNEDCTPSLELRPRVAKLHQVTDLVRKTILSGNQRENSCPPLPPPGRLSRWHHRPMACWTQKKPPQKQLYKKIYWNLSMTNRHKTQKFGSSEGGENRCRCSFIQMKHGLGSHGSLGKQSRRGTGKRACTFTRNLQSLQISTR